MENLWNILDGLAIARWEARVRRDCDSHEDTNDSNANEDLD